MVKLNVKLDYEVKLMDIFLSVMMILVLYVFFKGGCKVFCTCRWYSAAVSTLAVEGRLTPEIQKQIQNVSTMPELVNLTEIPYEKIKEQIRVLY